jgi:hypothetical protein
VTEHLSTHNYCFRCYPNLINQSVNQAIDNTALYYAIQLVNYHGVTRDLQQTLFLLNLIKPFIA